MTGTHVLLTHIDPTRDPRDTGYKSSLYVTELGNLNQAEVKKLEDFHKLDKTEPK